MSGSTYKRWVDTCIALMVIFFTIGMLLPISQQGADKARFSEVLISSRVGQVELIERLAINGPEGLQAMYSEPRSTPVGRFALSAQIVGDTYRMTGTHDRTRAPFALMFTPSMIQGEPTGSVNWLCGHYGATTGWSGPTNGPGTDLPLVATPFVCRANAKPAATHIKS